MRNLLKRCYYRWINRSKQVKIGGNVIFNIHNTFEGQNVIGDNAVIGTSYIGYGTYIANGAVIKNTITGRFCSIGSNVQTGLGVHPSNTFVSTHPAFFSTKKQAGFTFTEKTLFPDHIFVDEDKECIVKIGNDVWIGNNVLIMDGITIGDGAIIAAGAVVTKNIPPYTIAGGIPAKILKQRFTEQQIEKLLAIKWWNWDVGKIKNKSQLFNDIQSFISSVAEEEPI
ncbi:hypothetical protein I5M19_15205 [Mucilaginibacter sp. SD-g]|uniref:CatB-related O-acetyltransferase n=1 Tax=Mucilaginibacter segetis TaxID=2793071 RepID=A0A934PWF9_9SPHI|nr:CatB-related O-acetyltransferase [Mucilaginibacter segetis]MBK0380670.1 hypothetical protein [Mucilaginibacter segetis]